MAPPYERPSSVTRLAVGRCPATEKVERVLSVSAIPTTPGASVASTLKSEAAIGRRLIASDLTIVALEPVAVQAAAPLRGLESDDGQVHPDVRDEAVLVRLACD